MKLGAEPKKIAILAGLVAVAGYLFFSGESYDQPPAAAPRATSAPSQQATPQSPSESPALRRAPRQRAAPVVSREFRPSLTPRRPEDRPDPMTIDPTLRLDLLAKLQEVRVDDIKRSLFEFSTAPPPKASEPKILPKESKEEKELADSKPQEKEPVKPPPPPIRLKFYGYVNPVRSDIKRAFFLDGEDIFVAEEGDVIQKRYKVVKIGVNSAVLEDTEHEHQQTIKMEEESRG